MGTLGKSITGILNDFYPSDINIGIPNSILIPKVLPKIRKPLKRDKYSDEYDVRACVVSALLAWGVPRNKIRIEIPLDHNSSGGRADIIVIGDRLRCIEIKSGKDIFDKSVNKQVAGYKRVFDSVALVADLRHRKVEEKPCRSNWDMVCGSYCHETKSMLGRWAHYEEKPKSIQHHDRLFDYPAVSHMTSPLDMACILWAGEIKRLTGWKSKSGFIQHATENLSLKQVRDLVRTAMIERPFNKWEEKFWTRFDSTKD